MSRSSYDTIEVVERKTDDRHVHTPATLMMKTRWQNKVLTLLRRSQNVSQTSEKAEKFEVCEITSMGRYMQH